MRSTYSNLRLTLYYPPLCTVRRNATRTGAVVTLRQHVSCTPTMCMPSPRMHRLAAWLETAGQRPVSPAAFSRASTSVWWVKQSKVVGEGRYTVKGGQTGDFGGDSLEQLRRWRGAQWPGLYPGSAEPPQSRQARAEQAQGASWGPAKGP